MAGSAVLFAGIAAALFGLNVHIHRKGLNGTDGWTGAFLSVAAMSAMFWLLAPWMLDLAWLGTRTALVLAIMGVFFPALGQTFQIQSVARVGPAMTAIVTTFTPVFAIVPAILLFGEAIGPIQALALALMACGLLLAAVPQRGLSRSWPLWALLLPLGASAVRGLTQPVIKTVMAEIPSPYFAALITGSVSALLLGILAVRKTPGALTHVHSGHLWFCLSGIINGFGILALNAALGGGALTVVSPIVASAPLFALFFGATMFRHERLGARHMLIAALVVGGAVMLVTT